MVDVRIKSVVEVDVGVIEMVIRASQPVSLPPTGDHKKDMVLLGEHNKEVDAWRRLHCGNAELIQGD